ncbi:hypothetical protein pb186bvf_006123 [Paramecium bursaria]
MIKQSRSKEQTIGKMMKIYVAQMLLNAGVQSCQEQGINLLSELLVKSNIFYKLFVLRVLGLTTRKVYELQGRQEGDLFHVLIALNKLNCNMTKMITYFKQNTTPDNQLNFTLKTVMESIFKEKYGAPEQMNQISNLRQKPQIQIQQLEIIDRDRRLGLSVEDLLKQNFYYKNQIQEKQKKEITEKELKEEKKKYQFQLDEDYYSKTKKQQRERKFKKKQRYFII